MTVEWWLTSYQLSSALRLRPAVVIDSIEPNKPSLKIHTFNFTIEKKNEQLRRIVNYAHLQIFHSITSYRQKRTENQHRYTKF